MNNGTTRIGASGVSYVIAALALMAMADATAAQPTAGQWGEPRKLLEPADERFVHLSWPKVVRTEEGTIIIACSAGIGHNIGGSGPAVARSTDGGESFTQPLILKRFPDDDDRYEDCGNLALGLADDGAVVLLAMAYAGNERNTIVGWRSTDEGRTWQRTNVSSLDENKTGSVFGAIFNVPGRGLTVFGHYRGGSREHEEGIWMAHSTDGGRSWGEPRRVLDRRLFEPAVTYTEGRFVGLIRDGGSTAPYWQAVSDDGEHWSLDRGTVGQNYADADVRLPSPFITADPRQPRRLWALETHRVGGRVPGAIALWTATLPQKDWRKVGTVVEWPGGDEAHDDIGYPWMIPLGDDDGDDRWLVVFYSGDRRGESFIYGLTLRLDAATGEVVADGD